MGHLQAKLVSVPLRGIGDETAKINQTFQSGERITVSVPLRGIGYETVITRQPMIMKWQECCFHPLAGIWL